jgi:hypothetical protein
MADEKNKNFYSEIVSKAMKDSEFKKILKEKPVETMKKDFGIDLPEGLHLNVVEDTESLKHIVIPYVPEKSSEIDDQVLEHIAGGIEDTEYTRCFGPWYACG